MTEEERNQLIDYCRNHDSNGWIEYQRLDDETLAKVASIYEVDSIRGR